MTTPLLLSKRRRPKHVEPEREPIKIRQKFFARLLAHARTRHLLDIDVGTTGVKDSKQLACGARAEGRSDPIFKKQVALPNCLQPKQGCPITDRRIRRRMRRTLRI